MRASSTTPTSTPDSPALKSQDVLAGLGAAPRELLATCLALFEDNTLQEHLARRVSEFKEKWPKPFSASTDGRALASLRNRVLAWMNASAHDDDLRLLLWMHLREAFDLPASTFGSLRSTRSAADDLVTAALASMQAGVVEKIKDWTGLGTTQKAPDSLDALAIQTLDELIKGVMQSDDSTQEAAHNALIQEMKQRVARLDPETQERLLASIAADELNDDAIRTLLLTGGGPDLLWDGSRHGRFLGLHPCGSGIGLHSAGQRAGAGLCGGGAVQSDNDPTGYGRHRLVARAVGRQQHQICHCRARDRAVGVERSFGRRGCAEANHSCVCAPARHTRDRTTRAQRSATLPGGLVGHS